MSEQLALLESRAIPADSESAPRPGPPCTVAEIRRGLERRYRNGWLVLHEVANSLGSMPSAKLVRGFDIPSKRYMDTIAIGLFRSTKHRIIAHEIKVRRSDWLAELRMPEKAGAFTDRVHGFYVVAPRGVVKPNELPDGWGHLVWYPTLIRVARKAILIDRGIPPTFVASLLARCNRPLRTVKGSL